MLVPRLASSLASLDDDGTTVATYRQLARRVGVDATVNLCIDPEAVERVARLTHRHLAPGGAFWRLQAERLLSAFIWTEGKSPADGRLTVRDVSRQDLDVAARWEQD